MWNRRKDNDEFQPKPPQSPSSPSDLSKEGIPMSPQPQRVTFEPEQPRAGSAAIGKSVEIKGQIVSREDLTVDGVVEGTIELAEHKITIGPNGRLKAGIKAREILVFGTVNGDVEATDKIEIRKEAKLIGDIRTARIVIEDGAYFKGSIDIVKIEAPTPPKPQPKPPPPAVTPQQQTMAAAAGGDGKK